MTVQQLCIPEGFPIALGLLADVVMQTVKQLLLTRIVRLTSLGEELLGRGGSKDGRESVVDDVLDCLELECTQLLQSHVVETRTLEGLEVQALPVIAPVQAVAAATLALKLSLVLRGQGSDHLETRLADDGNVPLPSGVSTSSITTVLKQAGSADFDKLTSSRSAELPGLRANVQVWVQRWGKGGML